MAKVKSATKNALHDLVIRHFIENIFIEFFARHRAYLKCMQNLGRSQPGLAARVLATIQDDPKVYTALADH